jgi:predicted TIM-barrel fold metal-dependent hydrolase
MNDPNRPRLPVIDADCHVVEPFDLWAEELPEKFRPFARRRQLDEDANETLFHHGRELDLEWTIGALCTPGSGSAQGRLDVDIDTEVHPGVHDPTARLALMDEQGIAVSMLFPSCTLGLDDVEDIEFRWAYAETYNSWIARFCAMDPLRLRWGAVLPLTDIDRAEAELERCIGLGCSTVMLSPLPRSGPGVVPFADPTRADHCRNLGHPELDVLYRRLVEADMPATVHVVNPASNALGMGWVFANRTQWQMGQPFQSQLALLHVIDGGVLERFPTLRMGFFEGDVGWLPHWLGRMEETYDKFALISRRLARGPIQQVRDQLYVSGEPADLGLAHAAGLVGARRILFGSDWPHMDGAWPDPIVIVRDREDLTAEQKRAVLLDGPAEYFGLDMPALMAHLGPTWSLDAEVADLRGMLPPDYRPADGHRTGAMR